MSSASFWQSGSERHRRVFRGFYKQELEDASWIISKYLEKNNKVVKDAIQSVHDLIHAPQRVIKIGKRTVRRSKDSWLLRLQKDNISGLTGFVEMLAICMLYHNGYLIHSERHYLFTLGNRFLRLSPYHGTIDPGVQVKYGRLIQTRYGSILESLRKSLEDVRKRREEFFEAQKEPLFIMKEEEM